MIIKEVPASNEETAVYELPEPEMAVNSRPVNFQSFKFEVSVKRAAVEITRIDRRGKRGQGWPESMRFLVYSRNEFRYSFESTKYLYHGIEDERPPLGTTEIIVRDGVETIGQYPFDRCLSLLKITIPDTVTRIGGRAFFECTSLRSIQLPPNLQYVGYEAFRRCLSLEAIYIPSTIAHIGVDVFVECSSLRIINIPNSLQGIECNVIYGCDGLLTDDMKMHLNLNKTK